MKAELRTAVVSSLALVIAGLHFGAYAAGPKLHLEQVVADEASIYAVAVEVIGPTEMLLWDAQFHVADAKRLADAVARSHKHLKAIIISHPDGDHYLGASVILERFPGTPVYMTPVALSEFNQKAEKYFQNGKAKTPDQFPDKLVNPQPLSSMHFTVDGEDLEVVPDVQGDVLVKSNSFLWIPSLRAVLASDIVFSGVHPYLAASSEATRVAWRESLQKMKNLHPLIVVAGHKKDAAGPDSPDVLDFMDRYISDFDAMRLQSPDSDALFVAMNKKYPDLAIPRFLQVATKSAFPGK
jgi:glyoxylase-like metal-dependent hydrolase (beta-lactamase superfamily II)